MRIVSEIRCASGDVDTLKECTRRSGDSGGASRRDDDLVEPGAANERSDARKVLNLIEALEDQDDVQNVWSNFDISDAVWRRWPGSGPSLPEPRVGAAAPDFTAEGNGRAQLFVARVQGRPVVLVFYPGDATPVCTAQLGELHGGVSGFRGSRAEVLALSPQNVESHEAFQADHKFAFPLLYDENKQIGRAYGVVGLLFLPSLDLHRRRSGNRAIRKAQYARSLIRQSRRDCFSLNNSEPDIPATQSGLYHDAYTTNDKDRYWFFVRRRPMRSKMRFIAPVVLSVTLLFGAWLLNRPTLPLPSRVGTCRLNTRGAESSRETESGTTRQPVDSSQDDL